MAVSKELVVLIGVTALFAFAGAITVTVLAKNNCAFMIDTPSHCLTVKDVVYCCACADINNPKCVSKVDIQRLEGFGVSMIIFFWMLFAALGSAFGILYNKLKKGGERALLLE